LELCQGIHTQFDVASFVFDGDLYLDDPTLTLFTEFADPGDNISFDITGLTPNSSFDLQIDHTTVLSDTLDSNGDFSGNFILPDVSEGFHFLTAFDPTGKFGFNALIVSSLVGGELIPIETTSLILAGAQSFSWMIPVVLSGIGIGLLVVSRKSENS